MNPHSVETGRDEGDGTRRDGPRVLFVGDTSDRANWGSRATTLALRTLIERYGQIVHTVDMWDYIVGPRPSARHVLPADELARLPQEPERRLREAVPTALREFEAICRRVVDGEIAHELRRGLEEADVVVINGEGSFFDRMAPGRLKLLIGHLAKTYFDKPCVLVNHTSDLHDDILREMAEAVYPMFDDVLFREPVSLESVGPLCTGGHFGFAADAVFTLAPAPRDAWLTVAGRDDYHGVFPDSTQGLVAAGPYICVAESAAYRFQPRKGFDPVPAYMTLCAALREIAPVVLCAAEYAAEPVLRPVARELNIPIVGSSLPTWQAVDLLGHASLYVGGRWHAGLMALNGGTPVIMFGSNSAHKTEGLLALAGLQQPAFNAFALERHVDAICDLARTYLAQGALLRRSLRERAADLRSTANDNVRILSQFAEAGAGT